MQRRQFIRFTILGIISVATNALVFIKKDALDDQLRNLISDFFENSDHAIAVGYQYIAANTRERDTTALIRALVKDKVLTDNLDISTLQVRVNDQTKIDFQKENIIVLQGWILSRTECRICALRALL